MTGTTLRLGLVAVGLSGLMALTGCAGFFVDTTTTGTGTGTGTGTTGSGDYAFVVNQTTNTLSGFSIGSGALTLLTGSPYALPNGLAASSVEVSRANTFVYVGGTGAIECFSIGTTGQLTLVAASGVSESARFSSLATSPDGKWLLALDSLTQTLYVFGINTSSGLLSLNAQVQYSVANGAGAVVPSMVKVAPNGAAVVAVLGTGGEAVFSFNTSTGVPTFTQALYPGAGLSDNAVAIDANSAYVYIARGGSVAGASGVAAYSLSSAALLTSVGALATTGNAPFSVLLDATGSYAYVANRADGTISGYTVGSARTLAALGSSPYTAGTLVTALAEDNSKKYVVAASLGGSNDVTLYSFDGTTAGKLDQVTSGVSGTDPAGAVAVATTH